MQILLVGENEPLSTIGALQERDCVVQFLNVSGALSALRSRITSTAADAIVFVPHASMSDPDDVLAQTALFVSGVMLEASAFAEDVRALPNHRTMPDGRRWKRIPIVIYLQRLTNAVTHEWSDSLDICAGSGDFLYETVAGAVSSYRRRLLSEFSGLGYLVFYDHGRLRVGPAMVPHGKGEGELYSSSSDTRRRGRLFTIDRDVVGRQYDVDLFEALINREDVRESEIQQFFNDNPHFLSVNQFVPIPHPRFPRAGRGPLIPDFVLKPIVAQQRDSRWQVLDLKLPNVRLTAGPPDRPRLSHHVSQALAQLRDYRDYFQQEANAELVAGVLGHRLRRPRLAVLIGRMPRGSDLEALESAQSEQTVRIVTYDEVLEDQRRRLL